ncbi:probable inactive tRNA-specific adenosine deaminase-like protein 3 [Tribolium castaneum]|uniref:Putative inactive tRNA-specific adenosine deaminase-like protein 3 n=1 Tax=Tribolium castaneum TaxID=7070 RepID=D6WQH0_TRICA|nr:PREDICTED: probable inactive tRNA-specific adenosine deaminase-like protein 3 [Tribolium castaneum]EFA06971.1 putative inactive tRNA-specific adenosine deaminase-like protein 3 [Tribolium castaneum]|eukprot:XP_974513.1 PREDICTED: probable inactive tRNA-specific adenosine deaminase-like protein 3 [Tribolium castaneum]
MNEAKRLKLEVSTKAALTPVLADDLTQELPLIEVYLATIKDPKTISRVVVELNSLLPVPELTHLKRVKGREILLFPKEIVERDNVTKFLSGKGFNTNLIESDIKVGKVAQIAPKVRKQYEVVHKLWPCNFHSNPYLEKLSTNSLFTQSELEKHAEFMRIAIDICEITGVRESAVVVDPVGGTVVAFGFDLTQEYPVKHAVMVAIDEVARTQKGGVWERHQDYEKIQTFVETKYKNLGFGFSNSAEGPYLCTGYSVYCTTEPCITCAMALVHSRAKRVFYGVKSAKGALGSLCKIHVVENLNHHYEAFSGLLEEECRA